ncbi:MAG: prepilin peptidase [Bdellovibrionales bacterium]|nr:prepilin peptidase [Bdellovibrionales bacterium]
MLEISAIIFGLLIGSFLSVCIYRIPLGRSTGLEELEAELAEADSEEEEEESHDEEDITYDINSEHFEEKVTISYPPRSFCPHCGAQLRWWHNIPVFSWVLLLGKCAFCKTGISPRYPFVELLSAFFCYLSVTTFPLPTAIVIYLFCAGLIVLSFIDIDYYLLPNVITYPGFLLGIILALVNHFFHFFSRPIVPTIWDSLLGVLVGAGVLELIARLYMWFRNKQGLGMGDIKLLAVTGAFFGMEGAIYTMFVGSLLGSFVGIFLILIGQGKLSKYLPFGPYLAIATLLYVFTGKELLLLFFQTLGTVR